MQENKELVPAHDPVMIQQGDTYYMFCTGPGIAKWSSKNTKQWKREKPVFSQAPEWAVKAVPGFKNNHTWAPDISSQNGHYYLYYSISAFGKNTSCIGVAQPEQWRTIASRPRNAQLADSMPGDAAIEEPFIFKKGAYYYLFTSFDYCCRGPQSTYKMVVGRAKELIRPYVDKAGVGLEQGGGTLVMEGNKD
ncbi:hypothetical protein SAMN00120144_1324 [Hymenobacter roseosalivarius DSM 11622]|uniref:Glycoside hydrolase family 43 n=1 Tax=Hymenobacter roseosalivarius DSM 11622 TaxID=645990 RepID=A0A1W1W530_9BACT|nr:family 43 glycosylhydrolase [Hymenobacter roseosalivarius]SMC00570.1 hypothetical protein SAMN00120144_1324 [Hymenobacter roseosalivarius DSM 11622]